MKNILTAIAFLAIIIAILSVFASCRSFLPDISLSDLVNISETTAQPAILFDGNDDFYYDDNFDDYGNDSRAIITPSYIRAVFDDIYTPENSQDAVFATEEELTNLFYLNPEDVREYYLKYSSGKYGVADVYLVRPAPDKQDTVINALEERRAELIKRFEHFNVHNSHGIAQESKITIIGDYVALVIIEDAEAVTNYLKEKLSR